MHPLVLNAILMALSGSQDWKEDKFKDFCNDINPLLCRSEVGYKDICPIYDKYIHKLELVDSVLDKIENN